MTSHVAAKVGVKQETIAIVAVGLTILGTMLFTTTRLEARIDRVQVEARADWEALSRRIDRVQAEFRAEARADREAFTRKFDRIEAEARADREAFSREILRLTAGQARLAGIARGSPPRVVSTTGVKAGFRVPGPETVRDRGSGFGDCEAPSIIAAAAHSGHRWARELDVETASAVPYLPAPLGV